MCDGCCRVHCMHVVMIRPRPRPGRGRGPSCETSATPFSGSKTEKSGGANSHHIVLVHTAQRDQRLYKGIQLEPTHVMTFAIFFEPILMRSSCPVQPKSKPRLAIGYWQLAGSLT
jgi:hypothetical protein